MSDYDGSGDDYASLRSKRNSHGSSHERSTTRDYKDRSSRVERGRGNSNNGYGYDRRQRRDFDRHRDYDDDRERRHAHRMRSRSRERSENRSRSPSSSRSRSKRRTSGFDMAPPAATVIPGAPIPGQLLGVPQTTPGVVQNILPFGTAQAFYMLQFSLPLMPAQAMTQQVDV
ncbi:hypothetical protein TIFTF001_051412 [Ficus carica]|uniref:Uncharacterized protein n=1 Tax=Ficus carica TaxID=3494 RepID=A0AA87Z3M9_FICCA|nr:hypothetical protein TIFTF001_051412 [Ficus carica]